MKEELWKVIPFESNYEISPKGDVRNTSTKHIKSTRLDKYGYERVTLYPSGKTYTIHRLVAEVWIPNPSNLPQINHIDFDKRNNDVSNLEWCTVKDNCIHRELFLDPLRISGQKNPMSRYTEEEVRHFRHLYDSGVPAARISRMFNLPDEPVRRIVKRLSWTHI